MGLLASQLSEGVGSARRDVLSLYIVVIYERIASWLESKLSKKTLKPSK